MTFQSNKLLHLLGKSCLALRLGLVFGLVTCGIEDTVCLGLAGTPIPNRHLTHTLSCRYDYYLPTQPRMTSSFTVLIELTLPIAGRKVRNIHPVYRSPLAVHTRRQTTSVVGLGEGLAYRMLQELFSRNGFTFWLEKPTSRQSSASCSVTYFTMSATACETVIRWMAASRRSCSVIARCCCRFEAIISITAVSDSPMVNAFTGSFRAQKKNNKQVQLCETRNTDCFTNGLKGEQLRSRHLMTFCRISMPFI